MPSLLQLLYTFLVLIKQICCEVRLFRGIIYFFEESQIEAEALVLLKIDNIYMHKIQKHVIDFWYEFSSFIM